MEYELTVIEKIWDIILEVITVVTELTDMNEKIMPDSIIRDNNRLAAFKVLTQSA